MFLCQRVGKIQALLVFCFGFACRQKPNVLECAVGIISLSFTLFTVVVFLALAVTCYLRNSSLTFANPHYVTFVNHFSFHSVNNMYVACYQSYASLKVKYTHFLLAQVVMLQFIFPQI